MFFLVNWWFCADKKVSVGIILAIVVGIVVAIVLISLGLVMFKRKKKNQDMQLPSEFP